jgi:hypothetical protein
LVEDVRSVRVERDDARELLTLSVQDKDGTTHPARSLSDGTLRFLALAVLEADPGARGVLCFEEPENGIHPQRIVAMLSLLQDLAVRPQEEVGEENPLRQVIINTHSPTVVAQVPDESLLLAERLIAGRGRRSHATIAFRPLHLTWREGQEGSAAALQRGRLLAFLNPVRLEGEDSSDGGGYWPYRRVIDRPDLREQLSLWSQWQSRD